MSDDGPVGELARPARWPAQDGAAFTRAGGIPPVLDLPFDSGLLRVLRAEVRAQAGQAGLPEDRAGDVVVAVHEMAANAVRHGGGEGRLRVWNLAGALRCQIDDGDVDVLGDMAPAPDSLPHLTGHGLWVARQVADQMQTLSGPHGTRVTLAFGLPAAE